MKIISDSHLDHGLTQAQIDYISHMFADRDAFFLETIELPEHLGTVPCGLIGPIMGDAPVSDADVSYVIRGARKCASRVVKGAALRPTRKVTVIAGPDKGETCVLYTAFGGPSTPREPGDKDIPDWAGIEASRKFWAEHALAG